jgi:hypothetical protein
LPDGALRVESRISWKEKICPALQNVLTSRDTLRIVSSHNEETAAMAPTASTAHSRPAPTAKQLTEAAYRIANGIFEALGPDRSAGYEIPPLEGPGIGSFERAQHCQSEVFRIQCEDRQATFAKCLASLDRSLAGIAASDDITRHLIAAE